MREKLFELFWYDVETHFCERKLQLVSIHKIIHSLNSSNHSLLSLAHHPVRNKIIIIIHIHYYCLVLEHIPANIHESASNIFNSFFINYSCFFVASLFTKLLECIQLIWKILKLDWNICWLAYLINVTSLVLKWNLIYWNCLIA